MNVVIFGAQGMLGRAVEQEASRRGHGVYSYSHASADVSSLDAVIDALWMRAGAIAINCAGVIPTPDGRTSSSMVKANALGPMFLAACCAARGIRLVHVSTDCVFNGRAPVPQIFPQHIPDAEDLYGRTKAIGEMIMDRGDVVVIRTSFIGPDHGLMRWFLDNREPQVDGYLMAHWSGSSVYEVARGLLDIAESNYQGIAHLATPRVWEKARVLAALKRAYDLPVKINLVVRPAIYRGLRPTHEMRDLDDVNVMAELMEKCPAPALLL